MSDQTERFGQCAPADATLRTRVEVAAALLCLSDPDALLSALSDAGLHVVCAADKAVLDAARNVKLGFASADPMYPFLAEGSYQLARAIHAERLSREGKP